MGDPFTQFILGAVSHPALAFCAIVLATFVLEDPATVAAALLAADGSVAPALALAALWFGVAAGDIGLYGLGRLGASSPLGRRWFHPERADALRERLRGRTATVLIGARFVPGLRLPTYTTAGMLGLPLGRFVAAVVAGTLAWTSLLFGASFVLGRVALDSVGHWRWIIGAALVLGVWLVERAVSRYHARTAEIGHG